METSSETKEVGELRDIIEHQKTRLRNVSDDNTVLSKRVTMLNESLSQLTEEYQKSIHGVENACKQKVLQLEEFYAKREGSKIDREGTEGRRELEEKIEKNNLTIDVLVKAEERKAEDDKFAALSAGKSTVKKSTSRSTLKKA